MNSRIGQSNLAALCLVAVLLPTMARAIDPDMARFTTAKQSQVREFAKAITNKVPRIVWSYFDAVKADDWDTATNLAARISKASRRYTNTVEDEAISPALATVIWPPIQEMIGTYEQFHEWDNKWLHRFGRGVIDSIPRGSIYFGGTDPGRFLITALSESHSDGNPVFTITQNQLADGTYMDYLRRIYGSKIHIPTIEDVQGAFTNYLADAQQRLQEGKLKPGEDVRIVDGRVQISGTVAVMGLNGILAKQIIEDNPGHRFFLEESFLIDWMYPYLKPHELIFELHAKPVGALGPETIQKDRNYWNKLTGELIGDRITEKTSVKELCDFCDKIYLRKDFDAFKGDPKFVRNHDARACYSKLRSSIAGLYVWARGLPANSGEKNELQAAAELAFKQAFAICPDSPEALFRYVNLLVELHRPDDAFELAKAAQRYDPDEPQFRELLRNLRKLQ